MGQHRRWRFTLYWAIVGVYHAFANYSRFRQRDDVSWIEASRDYLCLHVAGGRHLVRMTMRDAAERLDPAEFVRIHRSTIVRMDRIAALEPFSRSEDVALLRDGTRLRVSRGHREELRRRLRLG
jgi:two-component system LytT family response regulator